LAQEQNFTRTAELLNLTQPAVTQHVRALQEHFGLKLVDLVGRRTVLTDAGRFLAARAELLLGDVTALEREMHEFADVRAGELRIGATVTIGAYRLPDIVARFQGSFPVLRLRVEVENTGAMAFAVKAGRVSLALVEGPLADDELDIEPYEHDELVLVVPRSHVLARRKKPIRAAELANVPFVFREEGSGTRAQVERALTAAGVQPNVALRFRAAKESSGRSNSASASRSCRASSSRDPYRPAESCWCRSAISNSAARFASCACGGKRRLRPRLPSPPWCKRAARQTNSACRPADEAGQHSAEGKGLGSPRSSTCAGGGHRDSRAGARARPEHRRQLITPQGGYLLAAAYWRRCFALNWTFSGIGASCTMQGNATCAATAWIGMESGPTRWPRRAKCLRAPA
jgi:DNA-binding transcriptional LysR family regulator